MSSTTDSLIKTEELIDFNESENGKNDNEGWWKLSKEVFVDGVIGAITFLIMMLAINVQIFIMGHIPNAELIIPAIGTTYNYMFIIVIGISGFCSCLLLVVSRCKANNDYKKI